MIHGEAVDGDLDAAEGALLEEEALWPEVDAVLGAEVLDALSLALLARDLAGAEGSFAGKEGREEGKGRNFFADAGRRATASHVFARRRSVPPRSEPVGRWKLTTHLPRSESLR